MERGFKQARALMKVWLSDWTDTNVFLDLEESSD
jgi:hypothetical protein